MKALNFLYAIWGIFWFWIFMLMLYPFFVATILVNSWTRAGLYLFKIWAKITLLFIFLPIRKVYHFQVDTSKDVFVYCANHTSFMDIALIHATCPTPVVFMGKDSLSKIPLFGFIFRGLNITVNRQSKTDSYQAFEKSKQAISEGKSITIFAEGGINNKKLPGLLLFKDGAFRCAIEKQVPIVPVIMPFNWIVLPPYKAFLKNHLLHITYLKPISTQGMTLSDIESLKKQVYEVMLEELNSHFPNKIIN
jgi:1-acyl-sn-glycerol-3-phosphate acyltransferase